ncbi:Homeobox protein Hox-A9 [Myotis brandtii]|uniref:Homeobox protein Hox-A9 n=1 Tax=Myotis brandtii TaxID=109478 RepID=S7PB58_MYOBR|nr:Homeobox protein Hox-A9 [Myotis brandtii]
MATTGALGNYYVDSFLLGADASDELGAGRYAPGALGQPARQKKKGSIAAVANLLDLTDHEWSEDHWLATADL